MQRSEESHEGHEQDIDAKVADVQPKNANECHRIADDSTRNHIDSDNNHTLTSAHNGGNGGTDNGAANGNSHAHTQTHTTPLTYPYHTHQQFDASDLPLRKQSSSSMQSLPSQGGMTPKERFMQHHHHGNDHGNHSSSILDMDMDADVGDIANIGDIADMNVNINMDDIDMHIQMNMNMDMDMDMDMDMGVNHQDHDQNHTKSNIRTIAMQQTPQTIMPPPPRQSEQTAREQLIERERQARLERERARLKRQLALSRERDEEDQAFADADIARVNSDDSIANTSIRVLDLHLSGHHDGDHHGNHNDGNIDDNDHDVIGMHHQRDLGGDGDNKIDGIIDELNGNDGAKDDKSMFCTIDDEACEDGTLHENGHRRGHEQQNDAGDRAQTDEIESNNPPHLYHDGDNGTGNNDSTSMNADKPASPLGFTMERFLQDGVVVDRHGTSTNLAGPSDTGISADSREEHEDENEHEVRSGNGNIKNVTGAASITADSIRSPMSRPISEIQNTYTENRPELLVDPRSDSLPHGAPPRARDTSGVASNENTRVSSPVHMLDSSIIETGEHEHHPSDLPSPIVTRVDSSDTGSSRRNSDANVDNQPRLARLTEQEILEMTEIDFASVGNMPPRSVRDEQHLPDISSGLSNAFSDQTQITMQESISETSVGGGSRSSHDRISSIHMNVARGLGHLPAVSPLANVASLRPDQSFMSPTSNTSLVTQRSDSSVERSDISDRKIAAVPASDTNELNTQQWPQCVSSDSQNAKSRALHVETLIITKDENSSIDTCDVPNRTIRPGMIKLSSRSNATIKGNQHRRAQTTPNIPSFVDDFDYCKYNHSDEPTQFSPPHTFDFNQTTPVTIKPSCIEGKERGRSKHDYGSTDLEEGEPLLVSEDEQMQIQGRIPVGDMMASVFSSVRSLSTDDIEAEMKDCDKYLANSIMARAFPDRFIALVVTLVIEIPVLLMIAGGSDKVCSVIGRRRYQLLMAFLPLSSAISGNCGLQASALVTRSISHLHVTKDNYMAWLFAEIQVASLLGLGIGALVGAIAYQASSFDTTFGLTVGIANFIGVLSGGLTGTIAPLLFRFMFHQDAGKWSGPLETAIQDIISTFVTVLLSYHILRWLGPAEIHPNDICEAV